MPSSRRSANAFSHPPRARRGPISRAQSHSHAIEAAPAAASTACGGGGPRAVELCLWSRRAARHRAPPATAEGRAGGIELRPRRRRRGCAAAANSEAETKGDSAASSTNGGGAAEFGKSGAQATVSSGGELEREELRRRRFD